MPLAEREKGAAVAEQITHSEQAIEQARDAVAREAWADAYAALRGLDNDRTTPDDFAALADAAWWTSRIEESIAARTKAYSCLLYTSDAADEL